LNTHRQYWEERLAAGLHLGQVGTLRAGYNYNVWLYRVRFHVVRQIFAAWKLDLREKKLLDIGSGTGFYIQLFQELGAKRVTGLDITSVAVENLRKKYPEYVFAQADIGLPEVVVAPPNSQHLITAFDVFFHIVDDANYQQALSHIYQMLHDDGLFVFSENFLRHFTEHEVSHVKYRSKDEILAILAATGFEVIERRPMFLIMNFPVDSQNILARKAWLIMADLTRRNEAFGYVAGMLLFFAEIILIRIFAESPSTEIVVCKKSSTAGTQQQV